LRLPDPERLPSFAGFRCVGVRDRARRFAGDAAPEVAVVLDHGRTTRTDLRQRRLLFWWLRWRLALLARRSRAAAFVSAAETRAAAISADVGGSGIGGRGAWNESGQNQ